MPEIGEIARGKEIGRKQLYDKFIFIKCPDCDIERWLIYQHVRKQLSKGLCHACSQHRHQREKHQNWKGGRIKTSDGYISILLELNDTFYPMTRKYDNYVAEHRLVMAQSLGRCLTRQENVHHLNGVRHDNRIENLALTTNKKHNKKSLIQQLQQRIRELEQLHLRVDT